MTKKVVLLRVGDGNICSWEAGISGPCREKRKAKIVYQS